MGDSTISFLCPACGIKLTVPATLAGVVGPCPSCGTAIQAPPAAVAPPVSSTPVQIPAPAPAQVQVPAHIPPMGGDGGDFVPPVAPAVLRPEPRHLPSRSAHVEPVAKQMPEPVTVGAFEKPNPLPMRPGSRGRASRFLLGILFLFLAGGIVYGVLTVLRKQEVQSGGGSGKPRSIPVEPILPENELKPPQPAQAPVEPVEPVGGAEGGKTSALPAVAPELPMIAPQPVEVPGGLEPVMPAIAGLEILEKFLAAKSLPERLEIMETKTAESELVSSVLAGVLPPRRSILIDSQEANAVEGVVDIYYNVDFEMADGQVNPQTLLVRMRGGGKAKVVVDPFLDTFGGRLLAYASKPSEKGGTFQVIISAVASCNNEDVPEREKKLTLKLLARDNTREIAQAYFGRQSKIGLMLEDGSFSLSYGKAKACTVLLRWNVEENPEKPYLEAIDLKRFDWNP